MSPPLTRRAGRRIFGPFGPRGLGNQDDPAGRSTAGGTDSRALGVAVNAREVHQEREGARGAGVARLKARTFD